MQSLPAVRDDIQDLTTRRALPTEYVDHIDPFLFLNHHGPQMYPANNRGLPFGPHPHRGFETVTFILEGDIAHKDSGGHENVIQAGGVQWMTAGSGLVHSETSSEAFKKSGGPLEILQLWLNLPSRLKMTKPNYIGLQKNQIPEVVIDDGKVRIELVSGSWDGHEGAFQPLTDVSLMVLRMSTGSALSLPVPPDHHVFFYVVRGSVTVNDGTRTEDASEFQLVKFDSGISKIMTIAVTDTVILFGHAKPQNEPIVAHGPFVMNTREEIVQAIQDFQSGRLK